MGRGRFVDHPKWQVAHDPLTPTYRRAAQREIAQLSCIYSESAGLLLIGEALSQGIRRQALGI